MVATLHNALLNTNSCSREICKLIICFQNKAKQSRCESTLGRKTFGFIVWRNPEESLMLYVLCILAHTDTHFFKETVMQSGVHVGRRIHGFPVSSETKVTDFLFPSTVSRQPLAVKVTD